MPCHVFDITVLGDIDANTQRQGRQCVPVPRAVHLGLDGREGVDLGQRVGGAAELLKHAGAHVLGVKCLTITNGQVDPGFGQNKIDPIQCSFMMSSDDLIEDGTRFDLKPNFAKRRDGAYA